MITIYGQDRQRQLLQAAAAARQARHPLPPCRDQGRADRARARPPSSPRTPTARCRCSSSTTAACWPNPTPCCSISPRARASLPADRYERGLAYQWLFFEQYSHEPYIAVRRALLIYPDRAKEATPERLASTLAGGEKALRVMEEQLQRTPFFAGNAMSVADIALYAYTHDAGQGGFDLAAYPAVSRLARPRRGRPRPCAVDWLPLPVGYGASARGRPRQAQIKKAGRNPAFRLQLPTGSIGPNCTQSADQRGPAFRCDIASTLARPPVHP